MSALQYIQIDVHIVKAIYRHVRMHERIYTQVQWVYTYDCDLCVYKHVLKKYSSKLQMLLFLGISSENCFSNKWTILLSIDMKF